MDLARLCRVRAVHGGDPERGSGYRISDRLVLTAAHVVATRSGPATDVQVDFPGPPTVSLRGEVLVHRNDGVLDAALVVLDATEAPPPVGPARWGRLTGRTRLVQADARGWAQVARETPTGPLAPDDPVFLQTPEHLPGEVSPPLPGAQNYHLRLPPPYPSPLDGTSPWAGSSGAALLADGLVIGVLKGDPPTWSSGRLTVVPAHLMLADEGFRAALMAHGVPVLLHSVELDPVLSRPPRRGDSPSALLRPENEVVPFGGRSDLVDKLLAWCRQDGDAVSVRLISGPGGHGKSRLAHEVAGRLRREGWVAGLLDLDAVVVPSTAERLLDSNSPVLAVIDYAEGRARDVQRLVAAITRRDGGRIRLLLLARAAGRWWDDEILGHFRPVLGHLTQHDLRPLTTPRKDAYAVARAWFTATLDRSGPPSEEDLEAARRAAEQMDLQADAYSSVLTIHLRALLDALARPGAPEVPAGPEMLEDHLLEHERRHWSSVAQAGELTAPAYGLPVLAEAVAMCALVGARDKAAARATLRRRFGDDVAEHLADWLATVYPATDDSFWGALQPDRLAERLVQRSLEQEPALADEALTGASRDQVRQAALVLSRLVGQSEAVRGIVRRVVDQPGVGPHVMVQADPFVLLRVLTGALVGDRAANDQAGDEVSRLVRLLEATTHALSPLDSDERALTLEFEALTRGFDELAATFSRAFPREDLKLNWVKWRPPVADVLVARMTTRVTAMSTTEASVLMAGDHGVIHRQLVRGQRQPRALLTAGSGLVGMTGLGSHLLTLHRDGSLRLSDARHGVERWSARSATADYVARLAPHLPYLGHLAGPTVSRVGDEWLVHLGRGSKVLGWRIRVDTFAATELPALDGESNVSTMAAAGEHLVVGRDDGTVTLHHVADGRRQDLIADRRRANADHGSHPRRRRPSFRRSTAVAIRELHGRLVVAAADSDGWVHAWHPAAAADDPVLAWQVDHPDSYHQIEALHLSPTSDGVRLVGLNAEGEAVLAHVPDRPPEAGSATTEPDVLHFSLVGAAGDDPLLVPVGDADGPELLACAFVNSGGVWLIDPAQDRNGVRRLCVHRNQVTALAGARLGGRDVIVSAHADPYEDTSDVHVTYLDGSPDERQVYKSGVGLRRDGTVLLVEREGEELVTGRVGLGDPHPTTGTTVQVVSLATGSVLAELTSRDYNWHGDLVANSEQARVALPQDSYMSYRADGWVTWQKAFVREGDVTVEFFASDEGVHARLWGDRDSEPVLIYSHASPIRGIGTLQTSDGAVVLFIAGTELWALRFDGERVSAGRLTTHTHALHRMRQTAIAAHRTGDDWLLVSAAASGDVRSSRLSGDGPGHHLFEVESAVRDLLVVRAGPELVVVAGEENGRLTITVVHDDGSPRGEPTRLGLGATVYDVLTVDDSVVAVTGRGIVSLGVPPPQEPTEDEQRRHRLAGWRTLVGGPVVDELNVAERGGRGRLVRDVPLFMLWTALIFGAPIVRHGLTLEVVPWLALATFVWSLSVTPLGYFARWALVWPGALAVVAITAAISGNWPMLGRSAAGGAIMLLLLGFTVIEARAPDGDPYWDLRGVLAWGPSYWPIFLVRARQQRHTLSLSFELVFAGALFGIAAAASSWAALTTLAVFPLTAHVADKLILGRTYRWLPPAHGPGPLTVGLVAAALWPELGELVLTAARDLADWAIGELRD